MLLPNLVLLGTKKYRNILVWRKLIVKPTTYLSIIFSVALTVACSPPEFEAPKKPKPPQRSYSVNLPPSIDLDSEIPPLKNPDGTFRIDGLQMKAKKYLDQEIKVTGFVTEISPCSNKVGAICPKPYLWISDQADDADIKLRIADMKRKSLRRFRVGKKYVFTGELSSTSKSGYANSNGILRLKEYTKIK